MAEYRSVREIFGFCERCGEPWAADETIGMALELLESGGCVCNNCFEPIKLREAIERAVYGMVKQAHHNGVCRAISESVTSGLREAMPELRWSVMACDDWRWVARGRRGRKGKVLLTVANKPGTLGVFVVITEAADSRRWQSFRALDAGGVRMGCEDLGLRFERKRGCEACKELQRPCSRHDGRPAPVLSIVPIH